MTLHKLLIPIFTIGLITSRVAHTCSVHEHGCIYHGVGNIVTPYLREDDGQIIATLGWNNNSTGFGADLDIEGQLPDNVGPYVITSGNYPSNIDPFDNGTADNNHARHVSTEQYNIVFQNNTSVAKHSTDAQGIAIIPNATSCSNTEFDNCESIELSGNIPNGNYKFVGLNYDVHNITNPSAKYTLDIQNKSDRITTYQKTHASTIHGTSPISGEVKEKNDITNKLDINIINLNFKKHAQGVVIDYIGSPYTSAYGYTANVKNKNEYIYTATVNPIPHIIKNKENILSIHSNAKPDSGILDGHSWISTFNINTRQLKTYGQYPDAYKDKTPRLRESTDVYENKDLDEPTPVASEYFLLDEVQEENLDIFLDKDRQYNLPLYEGNIFGVNVCASFATDCIYDVIGEDIDADDLFGAETPRKISESIWQRQK